MNSLKSKEKHTPGPWAYTNDLQKVMISIHITGADLQDDSVDPTIAGIWSNGERSMESMENDAKLIAAAPELLEALKELLSLAQDGYKLHKSNGCHEEFLQEDRTRMFNAREAIKKATL